MTRASSPALALLVTAAAGAIIVACTPASANCSSSSCPGCCDSAGVCQSGDTALACGAQGTVCGECGLGAVCSLHTCVLGAGTGGGSSSGGGVATGGGATTGGGTASGGGGATTGGGTASGGGVATGGGSGIGGGSSGNSTAAATQACLDYQTAYWDYVVRCGAYTSADGATSKAAALADCALQPGIKDGRRALDAAKATACASGLRNAACNANLDAVYKACEDMQTGLVPQNSACFETGDCHPGLQCDTTKSCPSVCTPLIAIGAPVSPSQRCVAGATAYGGVCVALVPVGQSCAPLVGGVAPFDCVDEASCDQTTLRCVATPTTFPALGQPCAAQWRSCGDFGFCIGGTCQPFVGPGGTCGTGTAPCSSPLACSSSNQCTSVFHLGDPCQSTPWCDANLFCNGATSSTPGTCAARLPVGHPCAGDEQCTSTLCANGTCAARGAVGQPCTTTPDTCDPALYCAGSTCAPRKPNGATCTVTAECQGGCTMGRCADAPCVDPTP